jgi:1-acyl-sn-glycerol-3-phosphate acyltransferase
MIKHFYTTIIYLKWTIYLFYNAFFLVLLPSIYRLLGINWQNQHVLFQKFGAYSLKLFKIGPRLVLNDAVDLNQQYIIVSNHRSWFDQISLMALWPVSIHFLAKSEYFEIPLFKYCLRNYQVIPVYQKHLEMEQNQKLNTYLQQGDSVVFFVEGTRGSGRTLLPFRQGAFFYAKSHNLPILPITILGSEQRLCKKNSLSTIRGGQIVVIVDKPVYMDGPDWKNQMKQIEEEYTKNYQKYYDQYFEFVE